MYVYYSVECDVEIFITLVVLCNLDIGQVRLLQFTIFCSCHLISKLYEVIVIPCQINRNLSTQTFWIFLKFQTRCSAYISMNNVKL